MICAEKGLAINFIQNEAHVNFHKNLFGCESNY
jgi:hypothetical protein